MKTVAQSAVLVGLAALLVEGAPQLFPRELVERPRMVARDVYTNYPYTGPAIPIGDWVDQSPQGNGKGYPRLVEPPAVKPASKTPTNNINVIALAYLPTGMNIHFQTPFDLGDTPPTVQYGTKKGKLNTQVTGTTKTYPRTPSCAIMPVTQCSEFFHDIPITGLQAGTTYFYKILASNGTTQSGVQQFTTAKAAGDTSQSTIALINDMGYTNAGGTMNQLNALAGSGGIDMILHGGDISYADDWYSGVLPCESSWPVCYNSTSTRLPPGDYPSVYNVPLPDGEVANQGSPNGGDMSVIYESNWDLWQQWMSVITSVVPHMTVPGNHEASCAEFDGGANVMTAYLENDVVNGSAPDSDLNYYSCPESQRNFTAYMNRFTMPGKPGPSQNMWYSFDHGLVHFVMFDAETDFPLSPEYTFDRELSAAEIAAGVTLPLRNETYLTNSGPFGSIDGGRSGQTTVTGYEQYKFLAADLAAVNRTKTPFIVTVSHRPFWSTNNASYQRNLRSAFQALFLQYGVDASVGGHIHWYERTFPLMANGTVDAASVINTHTYKSNPGVSITHIVNGQAGNIESHSTYSRALLPITNVLDTTHYGFQKLTVFNSTAIQFQFIHGADGAVLDYVNIVK